MQSSNEHINFLACQLIDYWIIIIIIADASNPLYQKTKLDEYINMGSGAVFMRIMQYQDVKFTQDLKLKDYNKKNNEN